MRRYLRNHTKGLLLKYNAIILEDNKESIRALLNLIEASPFADQLTTQCMSTADELVEVIESKGAPDVLFADIELDGSSMNGIDAVRSLLNSNDMTEVIYVTGYMEYCEPVYETQHTYFLVKPVSQDTFNRALCKAIENLRTRQNKVLPVTYKGQTTYLRTNEIEYVESNLRKVHIHAANGSYEMYATVSGLIGRLPASFERCHKSFLVNMDAVTTLREKELVMRSGKTVPLGQHYNTTVRKKLTAYLGGLGGNLL